ncbi:hypothetical protein KJ877_07310 [bacterium]|nr:hypothetical protein [bacterium]MBU1991267.1 hypothetical protein [bacterium]
MKYIIDMMDDIRENIQDSGEYTLLAMLVKEDAHKRFQNVGEKVITSLHIDHEAKQLQLGFSDGDVTTQALLACVNSLQMPAMMYEVMIKISNEHPLMPVIGFGENHEDKQYTFFVTT